MLPVEAISHWWEPQRQGLSTEVRHGMGGGGVGLKPLRNNRSMWGGAGEGVTIAQPTKGKEGCVGR